MSGGFNYVGYIYLDRGMHDKQAAERSENELKSEEGFRDRLLRDVTLVRVVTAGADRRWSCPKSTDYP